MRTGKEGLFPMDVLGASTSPSQQQNKKHNQRASSLYGAPAPTSAPVADPADVHKVVAEFAPQMPDELALRIGDKVKLKTQYDDGWAFGQSLTSKKEGLFPLDCLASFNTSQGAGATDKKFKQRASSLMDVPPVAVAPSVKDKDGNHTVTSDFDPQMQDEIELRVGDKVKLLKEYDDGWGTGRNLTTNAEGLLPLDCLSGFDRSVQVDDKGKKQNKARASSIYGAGMTSLYGSESVYKTESMYGRTVGLVAAVVSVGKDKDGFYTVTSDFDPQIQDEIELRVGDKVKLIKEYDDGWGTGLNTATNVEGLLPLDCLAGFDGSVQVDEKGKKQNKARASSVYGAGVNSMYGTESMYGVPVPAPVAASSSRGTDKDGFYTVTSDFDPQMQDEIELRIGDKIKLIKEYDGARYR
ncbi:hypothetical protein BC830DRAFT_964281 [Chytriomyces sp. MP71]|nr:hypothetical protein BC830DRAFT_964281 [Chytriomyces sp. MP71]